MVACPAGQFCSVFLSADCRDIWLKLIFTSFNPYTDVCKLAKADIFQLFKSKECQSINQSIIGCHLDLRSEYLWLVSSVVYFRNTWKRCCLLDKQNLISWAKLNVVKSRFSLFPFKHRWVLVCIKHHAPNEPPLNTTRHSLGEFLNFFLIFLKIITFFPR